MTCPECGETATCDEVDIGVGMQQCGPYGCESCGWVEHYGDDIMNLGKDIEHGGYPTSETRTIGQMRRDADIYAGIGRRRPGYRAAEQTHPAANRIVQEAAMNETQKGVDAARGVVVESSQSHGVATEPGNAIGNATRSSMILTLKGLSKNGKNAFYAGAANVLRIALASFPDKTAPEMFEVADGVFAPAKAPRTPRAKMTEAEKEAAKQARKNAPKPTLAERAAKAKERADKLAAQAAAEQPSL